MHAARLIPTLLALFLLTSSACAPQITLLKKLSPGLGLRTVSDKLGAPRDIRKFQMDGRNIVQWDYKLYHYAGAIEDVSPYFDIYTLTFVDGTLQDWRKTGGPTARDFEKAQAFAAAISQSGSEINRAFSGASTPAKPSSQSRNEFAGTPKQMIFGGRDHKTYLGCLSCSKYESDSIFNSYGDHGSKYSSTSIFNSYSDYGSRYSDDSACNPYAQNPPVVVDNNGNYYGRLTLNPNADPVDQSELRAFLIGLCGKP